MHNVAILRVSAENIGDNLAKGFREDALINVPDGVVYIFFRCAYAALHVSLIIHRLCCFLEVDVCWVALGAVFFVTAPGLAGLPLVVVSRTFEPVASAAGRVADCLRITGGSVSFAVSK